MQEQRAALGHHPLRVMGSLLGVNDARDVVFNSSEALRVGQVVAVPRSTGGLCYGEVTGTATAARCFFHPKHNHNQDLVSVRYGTKQKVRKIFAAKLETYASFSQLPVCSCFFAGPCSAVSVVGINFGASQLG
jgi:hypothetical protein